MKLCAKCKNPIESWRERIAPEGLYCAKCMGLDPDELAVEAYENDSIPDDIRLKILNKTRQLNYEKEAFDKQKKEYEQTVENQIKQRLKSEADELLGKQEEFEQTKVDLLQTLDSLRKELDYYVLKDAVTTLQNNGIFMCINNNRKTEKSPLLIGKVIINNIVYDITIWAHKDENNQTYWSGYLNSVGQMDGKINNRYIRFRKTQDGKLTGQIKLYPSSYDIEIECIEYSLTQLKYWKGKIL